MKAKRIFAAVIAAGVAMLTGDALPELMPGVRNPVMWADVPDPSLCSDGEKFYLVSTTMHLMPGAPIMRSKDLTGWETIGYAFDRFEEKPEYSLLDGKTGYGAGQWASSPRVPLRFDTGKFFMGSRFAIFNYATKSPGGSVAVDYFRMRTAERE